MQQRPRRWRGPWRAFMRLLSKMSYLVVAIVLSLITSIVAPGVGFVVPRIATTEGEWLLHIIISYVLTVGVLFNYLASTLTSPGTVTECCGNIPSAFRPRAIAFAGGAGCDSGTRCGANGCKVDSGTRCGSDGAGEVAPPEGSAVKGAGPTAARYSSGGEGGRSSASIEEEPVGDQDKRVQVACSVRGPTDAANGRNQHDCSGRGGGAAGRVPLEAAAVDAAATGGGSDGAANTPSPSITVPLRAEMELAPQYSYAHLRYCWPCRGPQTHGSHHCYICGRCVVDHDHHCPFIANCVGRANLRNFISFLGFTTIAMVYCSVMSAWLLIRDRRQASEAVETAAIMARRSYAAATAVAAAGGGSWFLRGLAPLMPRIDAAATYGLTLVARTPLHLSVAAYILIVSLAILASVAVLLSQTLRHAVRVFSGVDPAAAERIARHHVHPASDAAALEVADLGGWAATIGCLRRVMFGNSGVDNSIWMWVWPMWGPPPGVLVEPLPASECPNLEPLPRAGGVSGGGSTFIKTIREMVLSTTGTAAARVHSINSKAKTQ
ncbi:hypothetical protein Vretimale_1962 [Volvox reticuliferus]|uniref:S-acyltransferase n=2 Tax=Volvox reticuliferus TaxID=1737510 RepID=A0A8J4DAE3_9CHLO|nr:hypothetical protein Vretifemale_4225 [Volvox reticuliferus]GIL96072.1 hypothetical protein Vretimale_1962 [Volvox reticuliferus]